MNTFRTKLTPAPLNSPTQPLQKLGASLPLDETTTPPGYLAIAEVVQGFRKQIEESAYGLAIRLFEARGKVIGDAGTADQKLLDWLSTQPADAQLNLQSYAPEILSFIEDQALEIPNIYEQGAWKVNTAQLSVDSVNQLMNGVRDYNFTLVQTSSADNLTFQGYLQSIGQSYYLLNQLQVVMNDIMKSVIQAIR